MLSHSGCDEQMIVENKYTPERGCFEDKILSFIYPLLASLSETAVSVHNLNRIK